MTKLKIKNKFVFIGDLESINSEIIIKSFNYLKNKVNYIVLCNRDDLIKDKYLKKNKIELNEILDPLSFNGYKRNKLNIFNIENVSNKKYLNLLNQIKVSNDLSNMTKFDLITMPINKALFKKKINFIGMTEYFGLLNNKFTIMLMCGDKFSIIPISTHINIKNVHKIFKENHLNNFLKNIFFNLNKKIYNLKYKEIKFLCYNPHCGEDGTIGREDIFLKKIIKKYKLIKGLYSSDSAFFNINKKTLFLSTYHDQALIPFKILNKRSFNLTIGLNYRRLSPAHGTAKNIKGKNIANNTSYITCLLF